MNEHVFALDIGTQSVTGILLAKDESNFTVTDFYTEQHKERAMLDGQIQDVVQVAEVITSVKSKLEEKHGPLRKVCVAAAGRALKTIQTTITIPIDERPIKTEEEIKHIELSAVQQAQLQLAEEQESSFYDYYCVGYSVVHYRLDGEKIGSFIDQTGEEVSVEVIATFLPKVVVESLIAALERADLEMAALTLEPIAAIHVLIPESMRRLNVALIDIGAGTSDLAIARDGTIVAYGMVPIAGDEITEKISDHFLLDFKQAEYLKQKVVDDKVATVEDILGFEVEVTYEELVTIIDETVDHLAQLLADKVKQLNTKAPQAIMLIGGGSLTPLIEEKIANYLDLPNNRVAVRGSEAIQINDDKTILPKGPDFVTPIGIAISATENPFEYMNIYVNGRNVFLFTMDNLTIGDCLVQAGIDINDFYGKIGLAYFVKVNGEEMALPGTYGSAPTILRNGEKVTVNDFVQENDRIDIIKGKDGTSPTVTIEEIIGTKEPLLCFYNGQSYTVKPTYKVNNTKTVDQSYVLEDNDEVDIIFPETIGEFLHNINVDTSDAQAFQVFVDGQPIKLEGPRQKLLLNGEQVTFDTPIVNGAKIEVVPSGSVTVQQLLDKLNIKRKRTLNVIFNDRPITLEQPLHTITRQDKVLTEENILNHGDELEIKRHKVRDFIFQDVFRYADLNIDSITGSYELLRNEEQASFHDVIQEGDRLTLKIKRKENHLL